MQKHYILATVYETYLTFSVKRIFCRFCLCTSCERGFKIIKRSSFGYPTIIMPLYKPCKVLMVVLWVECADSVPSSIFSVLCVIEVSYRSPGWSSKLAIMYATASDIEPVKVFIDTEIFEILLSWKRLLIPMNYQICNEFWLLQHPPLPPSRILETVTSAMLLVLPTLSRFLRASTSSSCLTCRLQSSRSWGGPSSPCEDISPRVSVSASGS